MSVTPVYFTTQHHFMLGKLPSYILLKSLFVSPVNNNNNNNTSDAPRRLKLDLRSNDDYYCCLQQLCCMFGSCTKYYSTVCVSTRYFVHKFVIGVFLRQKKLNRSFSRVLLVMSPVVLELQKVKSEKPVIDISYHTEDSGLILGPNPNPNLALPPKTT